MKILLWLYVILGIALAAVIMIFALSNRDFVTIDLWPFERSWSPRLGLLVLYALVVGFLTGMIFMWFNNGSTRDKKRRYYYQAQHLERELAYTKRKLAEQDQVAPERSVATGGSLATRLATRSQAS